MKMPLSAFVRLVAGQVFLMLALPVMAEQAPPEVSTEIRFFDSATGFALQPDSISAKPRRPGAAERRFDKSHVSKAGRAMLSLEAGAHNVTASAHNYKEVSGMLHADQNPAV